MGSLNKRKNLLSAIKNIRGGSKQNQVRREPRRALPDLFLKCDGCNSVIDYKEFVEHLKICPECGHHMKMNGRERFEYLMDEGYEKVCFGSELKDPISFPKYAEKRAKEEAKSGLNEAISIVKGTIEGKPVLVAVLELQYMMGSLGTYVGEELTAMFEYAIRNKLPVIIFSASGGARMQEGIFSLMQMAKTSAVIGKFQDAGLLYISVLTNPTTGGVSASFASLGDIIIAEPNALIGFAGPRVIEQTIKKKLPKDFQRAEKLEECGFVDMICERESQRRQIAKLLKHHVKIGAKYE
ncbi:acetyl-CoA carboxylase, carboxyltransferase subunit beta [Mogibacterium pumilum]|uniref:Acetyl-coenzyme A carboxylase carboxyl transferase subunit beta n=1 Tax=Mogibacterium pumilum TaxID=86332 RepID=A0A223AS30_9FIRM|nr:acetyl-CoA carboxylase, carboxyltransferase subunit beta [Mogibacterium pumilum]ASS37739.1 acetyl-CoA carboxylase subunit beta [Mogibacterium pumilum]